jgi:hypothetical protein
MESKAREGGTLFAELRRSQPRGADIVPGPRKVRIFLVSSEVGKPEHARQLAKKRSIQDRPVFHKEGRTRTRHSLDGKRSGISAATMTIAEKSSAEHCRMAKIDYDEIAAATE